ncbi:hypothetical protein A9G07_08995 [Gilliamella sp. wkB72]|nr:hypothetical protein A9G07_08995 [Gilliamella apicola]
MINKIAPILHENGYQTDFNLINYKTTNIESLSHISDYYKLGNKISYLDNIKKVKQSDIILEIGQMGQTGVTLRAIEAILLNKRLITTNKSIKKYDFYSPEQIFILDENNYHQIKKFLESQFIPISLDKLYKYSSNAMLETITDAFD